MQFLNLMLLMKKLGSLHITGEFELEVGQLETHIEYLNASKGFVERLEMSGPGKYR